MARCPLACTVRGCGLPLERQLKAYVCPGGHTYDVARSGYVNLLQPQDRRSLAAGDAKAIVQARARLVAAGVGANVLESFVEAAVSLPLPAERIIVDLGSGTGDALAAVADRCAVSGVGIDLSTAAADLAARRFPSQTWVVANADRRLPLLDQSVDLVLSQHARRQPAECARVLRPGGLLLIAVPAPDDLVELRRLIQGEALVRERASAVVAEHVALFSLRARSAVIEQRWLSPESVLDLLRVTYRGRTRHVDRVASIAGMDVTLASERMVFERRN